ncbi:MAG: hypothetical protein JXR22_14445, partial [Prolixibacteraceae bacterium]|nr:hypothetical protein [Prolixibacteraceae bacterium]
MKKDSTKGRSQKWSNQSKIIQKRNFNFVCPEFVAVNAKPSEICTRYKSSHSISFIRHSVHFFEH